MSLQDSTTPVAVLLTQVATPQSLAAVCALFKIKATVVPSPIGAYAVAHETSPEKLTFLAANVTKTVGSAPAIMISHHNGQMKAEQWEAGERIGPLSPAIVLDGAPHELEDVLLGAQKADEVQGAVNASKISRFKAMRLLAANAKAFNAEAEK